VVLVKALRHPEPGVLERFLRGEATRADERAIVRHLLHGCARCAAALRPLWGVALPAKEAVDV
jgi:hypothetical protein